MIPYYQLPNKEIRVGNKKIASFLADDQQNANIDAKVVDSFGEEWKRFNNFTDEEITHIGDEYFDIVDEKMLEGCIALDVGCGTGRWSRYLSKKVKFIEAIDPSDAVFAAAKLLEDKDNIRITRASTDCIPFEDNSFDFVFSLGVLHHIPDTTLAMKKSVEKLKVGGYFLVYLYYDFENKSNLFRMLHKFSEVVRNIISKLPNSLKVIICDLIALFIYAPLVLLAKMVKTLFPDEKWYRKVPLFYYIGKSFYVMRNDSLDRFGTSLEQRFSKSAIQEMMEKSGLTDIVFSEGVPYWHAIGKKA